MDRKRGWAGALLLILLVAGASSAGAEVRRGFGLYGGFASYTLKDTPGGELKSSGLSFGIDYQIALASAFSLNPLLQSSVESVRASGSSVTCSSCTVNHGIVALQARFWFGGGFIGVHGGRYNEVRSVTFGPVTASASGAGAGGGVAIGYEAEGGFFMLLQGDSATINFDTFSSKLTGGRLNLGYRWK